MTVFTTFFKVIKYQFFYYSIIHNTCKFTLTPLVFQEDSSSSTHLSFKISSLDAFIAYIDNPSELFEISPEGSTYVNSDNNEIQVKFLPEIVDTPTKVQIKVSYIAFIIFK